MSRPVEDSNPQPLDSCRMLQPIELPGPDICCPMFLNTGSGGIDIFEVKLTFEILTVRNSIHFRHTNGCSCESVKDFETENISTSGGLEPPTFGFMPNALTYWAIRAKHLLSHVFEHWLWRCRYFLSKAKIWNVNCARATAFVVCSETRQYHQTGNIYTRRDNDW